MVRPIQIKENIKILRKLKQWTQDELADKWSKLGIPTNRSSVEAYEEGRAKPPLEALDVLARYLGISMEQLIFEQIGINSGKAIIAKKPVGSSTNDVWLIEPKTKEELENCINKMKGWFDLLQHTIEKG